MGAFLYFLPGLHPSQVFRETLRDRGLGDTLRDCLATQADFQRMLCLHPVHSGGPGPGSGGTLIVPLPVTGPGTCDAGDQPIGWYPERQTWEDCTPESPPTAVGGYWLGTDRDHPPTPAGLQRSNLVPGLPCALLPEQIYECPLIRCPADGATRLPRVMGRRRGEFRMRIAADALWAWELAGAAWDGIIAAEETGGVKFSQLCDWAVAFLGVNYRIGHEEAARLGLLTTDNVMDVIHAALDWAKVEALLIDGAKKNATEPPTANSSPGPPAGSPAIAPPAATCSS